MFSSIILPSVILLLVESSFALSNVTEQADIMGFGLELILAKLEHLDHKITTLQELLSKPLPVREKPALVVQQPEIVENPNNVYESCSEVPALPGIYLIKPSDQSKPFHASCVNNTDGGGWTVIQHRNRKAQIKQDFYRNWEDYKYGFGIFQEEFWLGLESIHLLTSARSHEIYFQLVDVTGVLKTAKYSLFEIGDEREDYAINRLGSYSGTAGDFFGEHYGMKFSTYDRDDDYVTTKCAKQFKGGWWYDSCSRSNLNSKYVALKGSFPLDVTTIMIREID